MFSSTSIRLHSVCFNNKDEQDKGSQEKLKIKHIESLQFSSFLISKLVIVSNRRFCVFNSHVRHLYLEWSLYESEQNTLYCFQRTTSAAIFKELACGNLSSLVRKRNSFFRFEKKAVLYFWFPKVVIVK